MSSSISRRHFTAGVAGVALAAPGLARAADYPQRPVRIVTGFAPGGPADVLARVLAAHLGEKLNGTFIVENHPGAGGNIGCNFVARAEPDGTTLMVHTSALVINPSLYKKKPYDVVRDFTPLMELATSPNIFFTNPQSGLTSMADVVARAKADPQALSFSSAGIGTPPHLSGELLKLRAGIQMVHVPYPGGGPCVAAVLQGTVQLGCVSMQATLPMIAAGKLVPLAVTGRSRSPNLPNVPTMIEAGFPDFVTDTFMAFIGPAHMPQPVVEVLVRTTQAILNDAQVHQQLFTEGYEVLAGGPDAMAARIAREVPMWAALIDKAGVGQV